jgi:hypothetical protein
LLPSGCAIVVRAIRLGTINELCSESELASGLCIIDGCTRERFGGGRLQDYLIKSNTFAKKFVSNVIDDKLGMIPPEKVTGTPLESLRDSLIGQNLLSYGTNSAPLADVGKFLLEVGAVVQDVVQSFHPHSKCMLETKVVRVSRRMDSLWNVFIAYRSLADGLWSEEPEPIVAQRVCFCTGGRQEIPIKTFAPHHASKVVSSDMFNSTQGLDEARRRLQGKTQPRVVVIGGSHSAFSAAWVCLNTIAPSFSAGFGPSSIYIVHRGYIRVFYACRRDAEADTYTTISCVNRSTGQINPFGGLRGDAKELWRAVRNGEETRVRMVSIKGSAISTDGKPLATMLQKIYDEATLIVWACGYSTNLPPIFDEFDIPMKFVESQGQFDVDDTGHFQRIIGTASVKVEGLLGCGLGFGLKATLDNGELDGSSGRADGVAVYLKHGATLVLASVLGTQVYGEGVSSWEERISILNRRPLTSITVLPQSPGSSGVFSSAPRSPLSDKSIQKPYASYAAPQKRFVVPNTHTAEKSRSSSLNTPLSSPSKPLKTASPVGTIDSPLRSSSMKRRPTTLILSNSIDNEKLTILPSIQMPNNNRRNENGNSVSSSVPLFPVSTPKRGAIRSTIQVVSSSSSTPGRKSDITGNKSNRRKSK